MNIKLTNLLTIPRLIAVAFVLSVLVGFCPVRVRGQVSKVSAVKIGIADNLVNYSGRCPVEIRLTGSIVTTGFGYVRYQFVHSSGPAGPVQRLVSPLGGEYKVTENPARVIGNGSPPWSDRAVIRILSNPDGPLDSSEAIYSGNCGGMVAVTPPAMVTLGPAQGRFRVTVNGFRCNSPTIDPIPDGPGDEIYVFAKTFNVEMPEGARFPRDSVGQYLRTFEYGDISSGLYPQRIRGGSSRLSGANGGFIAGDTYPESPEKHSTNPQRQSLPQLVWEGIIARWKNAVVVIPTIWESDGSPRIIDWGTQSLGPSINNVGDLILNPKSTDQSIAKRGIQSEVIGQTMVRHEIRFGESSGDLPIGMREHYSGIEAEMFILTYDEAVRMVQQSQNNGGKAFPVTYTSAVKFGGSYTIYIQIDRLPD